MRRERLTFYSKTGIDSLSLTLKNIHHGHLTNICALIGGFLKIAHKVALPVKMANFQWKKVSAILP
jgi:hypothetical protein